jgi:hypothetical protein
MPQDIKTGSIYNTQVPVVTDSADIIAALTNYHYGVTTGVAPEDASVTAGIAGLFKSKANLAGPTFTGTVVLPATTSIGNVSNTELGYLDGVTSSIQTQIGLKANLAAPIFTGTIVLNGVVRGPTTSIVPLFYQPATVTKSATGLLGIADLLQGIILVSGTNNKTLTLPTGTNCDAGILAGASPNRTAFDWNIVNTGGGGITVKANTDHSLNGSYTSDVSLQDASGRFRTVKTGTGTFATYWLGR